MKIIKDTNYTTINNVFLKDRRLSLKAKGLLALIMSLPSTWDYENNGLGTLLKESKDFVYSIIDELISKGYCNKIQEEKDGVKRVGYEFFELPYYKQSDKSTPKNKKTTNTNKEEKTEKIIDEIENQAIEVLEYLNLLTGRNFRAVASQLKFIKARLKEKDIDVQVLKQVIELKVFEWKDDVKMKEYLRPETLFNPTKFETYLRKVKYIINNPQQYKNDVEQIIKENRNKGQASSHDNLQAIDEYFDKAYTG